MPPLQQNFIALKKGSKLYSIINQKCPRCHEGELFEDRNPYHLSKIFAMPNECSECGQVYQLEPSFYYGAMYVNYGLTVGLGIAVFLIMALIGDWELHEYLIAIIAALVVTTPFTFRLGRAVWINMFVKYKGKESA